MSAPKLTPDLEALFQAERESEPLPDGFGESLRARIGRSIGPGGSGGSGGDDGGPSEGGPSEGGPSEGGPSEGGPSEGGPADLSPASSAGSAASAAAAPVATGLGAMQIGSLLGVFGLGLTLGAFGHAAYVGEEAPPPPPIVEPSEPVLAELVPPEPLPEPPDETPPPVVEVEEVPERVTPPPPPTPTPTPMVRLDGRALLDQAQNALARGLAREALAALAEHSRTHRRGPLREERQALQVQALAADGQTLRAQQEAAIFLARYPSSLFRDVVERAAR